jgi:hypothetical protein
MFLKGSTCLCHVPFGVPPNGMTTDASGEAPDTAREGACAPQKETPIAQRYVKEQSPENFRSGHAGAWPYHVDSVSIARILS